MDEFFFRSSQKFENLQIQLSLAGEQGRALAQHLSLQARSALINVQDSTVAAQITETVKQLWQYFIECTGKLKATIITNLKSLNFFENIKRLLLQKWTKDNIYFGCIGFFIGILCGIGVGLALYKRNAVLLYMRAIQCNNYVGIEAANVVEDAVAPRECGPDDVIVNVKAASVNVIDAQICNGYGRSIRSVLMNHVFKSYLPVTLGRDCTGIITDIGKNVRRLEVGDEVMVSIPFWATGCLSQSLLTHQNLVAHKPKNTGYEAACSLPYSGTIALNSLNDCKLVATNCKDKRVLIIGGCTPVGCILVQILKLWKAHVTTTGVIKATSVCKALGAHDVICFPNEDNLDEKHIEMFFIELDQRDKYDFIIITKDMGINITDLATYCKNRNCIVSTLPVVLNSDSFGYAFSFFLWLWISFKSHFENTFGGKPETYGEAHMCYVSLERLKEFVESGEVLTVVDKVFHPTDIAMALQHIQSLDSIGSTIITFR